MIFDYVEPRNSHFQTINEFLACVPYHEQLCMAEYHQTSKLVLVFILLLRSKALCLTIRPVARKGYGSIAHEAKPNGLFIRGL